MPLLVGDYAGRVRGSVWERDLASQLRSVTEQERLEFVSELAQFSPCVALVLARRTLAENRSYEVLLDQGLCHADASGIRAWLECVVSRLGFRKVLRRLRETVESNPHGVAKALYWLPSLATMEEPSRDTERLTELKHDCETRCLRLERAVSLDNAESTNVSFYPVRSDELSRMHTRQLDPRYIKYACGGCGLATVGRVVASKERSRDSSELLWCVCSCEREIPTVLAICGANPIFQSPLAQEFHSGDKWPDELRRLYDEASLSYAAGAYTAAAMVARKVLMGCAFDHGAEQGKSFASYVDFIASTVLVFPKAKPTIDKIRDIGNEANHSIAFVSQGDAAKSLTIVRDLLNAIYSLGSDSE